jgi:3-hydroxyacyl-CoA dehydrogenase/3a,7a,12a-trihydroxy-5b-cholest-24-enoyl-CoA hydratase
MSKELRFDGRVAIVTGAGQGLGRSHALSLASRGAKVVVNDLGGSTSGEGKSAETADLVVEEIRQAGGEAVANYDSVENGDAIVRTAMDTWGRIDIVINNAGILRDKSFKNMTDADWDIIFRVHNYGAYKVTKAAWPIMTEQGYGRVLFTTSSAGIYGNFGQTNYGSAKLSLVGFANTLSLEGQRKNVLVNTIAPFAASRLTEGLLPPAVFDSLKPEYVTPLVAYLCSEDNDTTGGVFEVGGGFYSSLRWERTKGKLFRLGREVSPEAIQSSWTQINDFSEAEHISSVMESLGPIIQNVEAGPSKGGNEFIDVDEALGSKYPDRTSSYDERDLAIYALGVGAATDPNDDEGLRLVYEGHGGGMKALPTYAVIPGTNAILGFAKEGITAPGLNYGLDRLLHGEQYIELARPLPLKATLTTKGVVRDIWDKGKGALVVTALDSYDEDGDLLIKNEMTAFVRGAGGWGGDRGPSADINVPPSREPDAIVEDSIPENQALLYRLSGDWNPLHADPAMAQAFGFERPILHGLCTFGYPRRHPHHQDVEGIGSADRVPVQGQGARLGRHLERRDRALRGASQAERKEAASCRNERWGRCRADCRGCDRRGQRVPRREPRHRRKGADGVSAEPQRSDQRMDDRSQSGHGGCRRRRQARRNSPALGRRLRGASEGRCGPHQVVLAREAESRWRHDERQQARSASQNALRPRPRQGKGPVPRRRSGGSGRRGHRGRHHGLNRP